MLGPISTEEPNQAAAHNDQKEHGESHAGQLTHRMMVLMLQLGALLLAARIGAEIFERFLGQPAVLGELMAGVIIGPYALGPFIPMIGIGALFPTTPVGTWPVSPELWGVATLASVILLFMVGLETDFRKFLRFVAPGAAVGIGGVVFSFTVGNLLYAMVYDMSPLSASALFMGTVSTATSVGITARVLSDGKKLSSPEGTTIIAGAVVDDVLGILILAMAAGVAAGELSGESPGLGALGRIAATAVGFWLVATLLGIALSHRIARVINRFHTTGAPMVLGLGLALLLAGIAEAFGLAMIIGSYIMGLALSREELSHTIEKMLQPVSTSLVPIFFAVMGMLVDLRAVGGVLGFGLIYTATAVVSKVLGSALPSLFVGFNTLGAARIGLGMLPRGEVALIVAGIGMSQGIIDRDMFCVAVLMTLFTTLVAPPALVRLFKIPGSGLRVKRATAEPSTQTQEIHGLNSENRPLIFHSMRAAFSDRGFTFKSVHARGGIFQIHGQVDNEHLNIAVEDKGDHLRLRCPARHDAFVNDIIEQALEHAADQVALLHHRTSDA